jgi:hypothetical protein
MKVIAFIEEEALIKKILTLLGLYETKSHDPTQRDSVHIKAVGTKTHLR